MTDTTSASFTDFHRRAEAGQKLSVVFFGASLTWGANATDPQLTSYRAQIGRRLEERYPNAHFHFWDAAIGGTGSQLGCFRLERDVLRRCPDLVFLDFSANDNIYTEDIETLASYEAIVRKILLFGAAVVQVLLPFKPDVTVPAFEPMRRRTAHIRIAKTYRIAIGDAIELIHRRVQEGGAAPDALWPYDGGHPCDAGYELFADAAWAGFEDAVEGGLNCFVPPQMLYPDTYMTTSRLRLSAFASLQKGWRIDRPNLTSAFYDMLMSRWLDDEVVATEGTKLRILFRGETVLLFGESTPKSCRFQVLIDGVSVREEGLDAGWLGVPARGNGFLALVVAEGLEPDLEHSLEIIPEIEPGIEKELRLESVCIAGKNASAY